MAGPSHAAPSSRATDAPRLAVSNPAPENDVVPLVPPGMANRPVAPDPTALPLAGPPPVDANPPDAASDLYVDWVTPLQTPRALDAADFARRLQAGTDPLRASRLAGGKTPASRAIPEPQTTALIAAAALPLLALSAWRRRATVAPSE